MRNLVFNGTEPIIFKYFKALHGIFYITIHNLISMYLWDFYRRKTSKADF